MDEDVLVSGVLCVLKARCLLSTDVDGEIRLIAVSSWLANAKPLLSSALVCVDDVRDWTVAARGFPLDLGQFVRPPRRLAPLRCLGGGGLFPSSWQQATPPPS